jgi:hypothetical protein
VNVSELQPKGPSVAASCLAIAMAGSTTAKLIETAQGIISLIFLSLLCLYVFCYFNMKAYSVQRIDQFANDRIV